LIYCDTSVLLGAVLDRATAERNLAWFLRNRENATVASEWIYLEAFSVLGVQHRQGHLTEVGLKACQGQPEAFRAKLVPAFSLTGADFQLAETLCRAGRPIVRAADALHVAAARRIGAGFATFDDQQARAALGIGLTIVTIDGETA
jgi:uncharacterized protein